MRRQIEGRRGRWVAGAFFLTALVSAVAFAEVRPDKTAAASAAAARVLHFPADRSMGEVHVQDETTSPIEEFFYDRIRQDNWRFLCPAKGDVVIPAGKRVYLLVQGERACRDLSPLARLRPDDLYRLSINLWQVRGVEADRDILPHLQGLNGLAILELRGVEVLPKKLSLLRGLKQLEHLDLGTQDASAGGRPTGRGLDASGLQSLAELPWLRSLSLFSGAITDGHAAHLAPLRSLRELALFSPRLQGTGLEKLAALPNLQYLRFGGSGIRGQNLRYLPKCASLRKLFIGDSRLADADLAPVGRIARLEDLELDGVPVSDQCLAHLTLRSLKRIRIGKSPYDANKARDAGLAHLRAIPSLESVAVWNNEFTDEALAHLAALPNLRELVLPTVHYNLPKDDKYYYTDKGLEALSRASNLDHLMLVSPAITDKGVAHLARLPKLRELHLTTDHVTNAGVARLASLRALETLTLTAPDVTLSGLKPLNALTNLRRLELRQVRQDNGTLDLSGLTRLDTVMISLRRCREGGVRREDKFRDEDMATYARLPQLRWLQGVNGIGDAGLAHLAGLTNMDRLTVSGPGVTDAGLAHLANMKKLTLLHLTGGPITDAGLRHLEGLESLSYLQLQSENACSRAAIARLRAKLPNLQHVQIAP